MYHKAGAVGTAVAGAGGLAATGVNVLWAVLAGFALLGAGTAILRLVPRRTD